MVGLFKELCKGPVIVVDDGIDYEPQIKQLIKEIESNNLPVLGFKTIADARNKLNGILFSNFFIIDWKMDDTKGEKPLEVQIGTTGEAMLEQEVMDLIREFQKICLAPIFILSNFNTEDIVSKLKAAGIITDGKNYVFVENKNVLCTTHGSLVAKIETWIKESPHIYLAKCWTNEWLSRNTRIFWDLFDINHSWPVSFYHSFKKDGVDPILALRDTIFQLVSSEISLSSVDETLLNLDIGEDDMESLKKLYTRLVYICNDDIKKEIRPGDIFKKDDSYYLNIRPECDTTTRADPDPKIYLLKGDVKAYSDVEYKSPYGILERENQIVMLFLDGNDIVVFDKRKLSQGNYSEWKDYKICRVATPFITKYRHSYSSYLGRFGVPSYPIQIVDSIFKNKKASS